VQLKIAGKVETVPFVLRVDGGRQSPIASQVIPRGAMRTKIKPNGFEPMRVPLSAGMPITLTFERSRESNCGMGMYRGSIVAIKRLAPP